MIGTQPTGTIAGVVISAVAHEGLTVTVGGRRARLAIVDDAGKIIAVDEYAIPEAQAGRKHAAAR